MLHSRWLVAVLVATANLGCGASLSQRPVKGDAALGRVIVYRSGVAYFERLARPKDGKLVLTVPAERVDDFLKSLTIRDAASGRSLPVSFPTLVRRGDEVDLTIELGAAAPRELKITYVTESPAWKPSYRVELDKSGQAKLEAWAVVDNTSGESWKNVRIGVGSTSALSFKYDLHSVRFVERETLGDGPAVAYAPPTGGSPYEVARGEVTVVGNLALDDVDRLEQQRQAEGGAFAANVDGTKTADPMPAKAGKAGSGHRPAVVSKPMRKARARQLDTSVSGGVMYGAGSGSGHEGQIVALANKLKNSKQRVRVEGYARDGDADARNVSLQRANAVREALIANGVSADQVEAVGTGQLSAREGVRLLALAETPKAAQAKQPSASGSDPIGSSLFVAPGPVTIEKDRSAMLSMLAASTRAEQVYYYDPISSRGSKRFAFRAVRLQNPSGHTLDAGPFTIYAAGQFLGEGLSESIPPKSTAFIPFALDRELVVEPVVDTREEIDRLVTIQRGIVTTEAQTIRRTKLALANRGEAAALVYVRHQVPEGWKLRDTKVKFEKLRGAYLFPVQVPARGAIELEIEEGQPLTKTVDINTDSGVSTLAVFLQKSKRLEPELARQLDEIIKMHKGMADTTERIQTVESQMATYRERVDEIHAQLVTLRRVPRADQLSRNLAQKMEEISDRLQKATLEVTELKGRLMTSRVALADRLAELTLKKDKDERAVAEQRPPK